MTSSARWQIPATALPSPHSSDSSKVLACIELQSICPWLLPISLGSALKMIQKETKASSTWQPFRYLKIAITSLLSLSISKQNRLQSFNYSLPNLLFSTFIILWYTLLIMFKSLCLLKCSTQKAKSYKSDSPGPGKPSSVNASRACQGGLPPLKGFGGHISHLSFNFSLLLTKFSESGFLFLSLLVMKVKWWVKWGLSRLWSSTFCKQGMEVRFSPPIEWRGPLASRQALCSS